MAVANVTINAIDNMSATIARLQQQLNNLQRAANIKINGSGGNGKSGDSSRDAAQLAAMEAAVGRINSAFSRMGSIILAEVVSALKSAVNEIKNIDDELVVVRRVAGKTNAELAAMTKNAHKMAQEYGIAASDYLKGVSTFTKAGYGDQAEGLAELALKLQRAGDVTAEVAQQYMTAVDKAYNMQGSIEALTAAMDGANQIGNEFATDVGEIAAGIGKVASIASTAHVGIDELTSALGVITAVTQRSGTEAATALRAIFLNIIGDTKTEIEEGAKWTAGEIEGLRQVLELYAPDVVAAAEATGTLIDPMEAIGALAKSYQDGILTEAKLFSMVSDIGGKLRTNQLMVLIKNWGMYESMMKTFANAAGSVDEEVAQSMDSITAKTEQLHAAWVAMVNDTLSTGMIKGFLDGMREALSAVGNLYNMLGLVVGVVTLLKSKQIGTTIAGLFGMNAGAVTGGVRGIGLAVTAISAAFSALNYAINQYNKNLQAQAEGAQKQMQSAVSSANEISKLYLVYLSATEGTETYTQALHALAEALGITAEAASGSSESIRELTLQGLAQAAADARTALDEYNHARESMVPGLLEQNKTYRAASVGLPQWMLDILENYEEFNQRVVEVQSAIVPGFDLEKYTNAEKLVETYERALALKKEFSMYAAEHGGIDLTQFRYFNTLSLYISDMTDEYNKAKEMIDAEAIATADYTIAAMKSAKDIAKANEDLADGKADAYSTDEIAAFVKELDDLAGCFDQSSVRGKAMYDAVMKRLAELFPNLINYSGDAATEINTLAVALSTATKAKNAFDAAMENTPKENKGFSDYQSAYSAYAAEMEAGRVNSAIAMAAAQYLMAGSGKFDFSDLFDNGGFAAVNAAMKKGPWATVFGDAEKQYGEGFLNLLGKIANKSGQIMDSTGEHVIATYKKTGKQVEFSIDDMLELSKVTGLSLDQIWQSVQALGVYGETGATGIEGMISSLYQMGKDAGVAATETGKLSVDYGKLLQFMKDSGKTEGDWEDMKQWLDFLNEIGMIELKNVPDVEEGWQNYKDWAASAAESAEEAAESMGDAKEAAESAAEETPEVDFSKQSVDAVNEAANGAREAAQAIYDEYNSVLSGLSEADYTVTINANGDQVWTVTEEVETEVGHVTRTREITFDADGNVIGLHEVDINIDEGVRTERTVTFNAEGNIETFTEVEMRADDTAHERRIHYRADGTIESIEEVDTRADDTAHNRIIHYCANGEIEGIEDVETKADGVTHKKEYEFVYGANGDLLYAKVREFEVFADGSTSEPVEYTLDADDEEVRKALAGAEKAIADSTEGDHGEYVVGANTDGAVTTLDAIEKEIAERTTGKEFDYTVGIHFVGANGEEHGVSHGGTIPVPKENPFEDDLILGPLMRLFGFGASSGVSITPEVELSFDVEEENVDQAIGEAIEQAQQDVDAAPPIVLRVVPKSGVQIGETEQTDTGDKIVYQASFEIEDSDAVLDIFSELDKETGQIHRIKILTEGDGTQTIEETITDAEGLQKTYTTTIDAEGNVITTLETAEALATSLDRVFTLTANATGNANTRLDDLWESYKKLNGKKLTITTVVEGDTLPDMDENARGTDNFRGGLSLINEEGPELIALDGFAKILGHGEPTVANIPKGATIYTAQETAKIMRGVSGWGFPAFKSGTDGIHGLINLPDGNKEKPKDEPNNNGNGNGGGGGNSDKNEFWDTIKEYLEYGLKKIQYAIQEYQNSITLLERARDKILDPIETEIKDLEYSMTMLQYQVTLLERARDDAIKPLDEEINRLKKERQIRKEDEALEEKKLAVEKARADLEEAMHQRTVRYFNEETGQWEWMADQKAIDSAKEALDKAEEDLADAQEDYNITLLERQKEEIENEYQAKIDDLEGQIETLNRRKEDLENEETRINYEYDQAIKPLQDEMDALQETYDDLEQYYNRLVDAVEVPTDSLTKALAEMAKAAANYRDQLGDTIALLNTLYELAPGWNAVEMGDLGDYAAHNNTYGNYNNTNNNTNIYIDGIKLIGDKAKGLNDALKNAGLYK